MAYVPNNVQVYAAAFAGAMAGINVPQGAFITDPVTGDYASATSVAAVFAQAVDTAWGAVTVPNAYDIAAIAEASTNLFVKGPSFPIQSPVNTQANWTVVALALVAMVQQGDAHAVADGIVLPPIGGASVAALTNTFFVDQGTAVAAPSQDGSIGAPFSTITAAIAALAAGGTLLIVPADYSVEAPIVVGTATSFINLSGSQYPGGPVLSEVILPQLTGDGAKVIEGCTIANTVSSGNSVTTISCGISADITAVGYQDLNSVFLAGVGIQVNGAASDGELRGTRCADAVNPVTINMPAARTLRLIEVLFNLTGSANIVFAGPGGLVDADGTSFSSFVGSASVITNGTFQTLWNGWAKVIANVVVPALGGAELGYVDASTVGTILEGLTQNSVVVVNPQGDLAAAGAGGGFLAGARVSAPDTVRLAFVGTLAGGAANFTISAPINTVS